MAKKTANDKFIDFYTGCMLIVAFYLFLKQEIFNLGVFITLASLGLIAVVLFKRKSKRTFFESKNSLEKIRSLTPVQFENYICHIFDKLGFTTERVGGPNDGGIDVIATKNGVKHYIQCKKFISSQVTVGAMRDFYGAVVDKLTGAKAYFITTNVFTLEAEKFVEGKPIELIDGNKLMEYVRLSGIKSDLTMDNVVSNNVESCPKCGAQLVLRTARKGVHTGNSFYGCTNYPKCRFIKNVQ